MAGKSRSEEIRLVHSSEKSAAPGPVDHRNLAINVSGATLEYPLGPLGKGSLKANLFRMFGGRRDEQPKPQYVVAFHDVSIDISHGERVALIGRNGAGKSTLLRALAGIYPLKRGSIKVIGQVGTLLDIALGFETESTGRENIYYRGMAMGFSRKELASVEKEIVEFAGIGEFIDYPVRTYSAGMFVRLGFAISTQMSPDILLIDEVFGAGDADFQKRALLRMMRIVEQAGIMVIATHDLGMVLNTCTRAIWLKKGAIERDGPPQQVIAQYLQEINEGKEV